MTVSDSQIPILMGFPEAVYTEDTESDAGIPELGPRNNKNDSNKDDSYIQTYQDWF